MRVHRGEGKLVECVVRNNGRNGLHSFGSIHGTEVIVVGGTISGNKRHGVLAEEGKVIVAAAEHSEEDGGVDRPQTVSSENDWQDWARSWGGRARGARGWRRLPQGYGKRRQWGVQGFDISDRFEKLYLSEVFPLLRIEAEVAPSSMTTPPSMTHPHWWRLP